MSSPSLLLLLLLLLCGFRISAKAGARRGCYLDAIYNFGDSLADTGNFICLDPMLGSLFTRFPYGVTLGKPTGRPSDGLLSIDYFALKLGLPLLPSYLDKNASFTHGINFAVSGATGLDFSFLQSRNITNPNTNNSLGVQLNWFDAYKNSLCSSEDECAKIFKRSLFFVGEFGANDFNSILIAGPKTIDDARRYSPLIVDKIISSAKRLVRGGATQLVILGMLPFGCSPFFLTAIGTNDTKAYDRHNCFRPVNDLIRHFNGRLKKEAVKLRKKHPEVDVVYADYYGAVMDIFENPKLYGFDEKTLTRSCCGIGGRYNFDPRRMCGMPGATVCRSPSRYVFWDGAHLTQEANKVVTARLLSHGGDVLWRKWICVA